MKQLSVLSKQQHLEIQAMKPMMLKQPSGKKPNFIVQSFQISATGNYIDLISFMAHISTFPILAILDDFQITMLPTENILKLVMLIDLYARK